MTERKYVIIDGQLQRNIPETAKWARRASKALPGPSGEPEDDPIIDLIDRRSDYRIIEELNESPE